MHPGPEAETRCARAVRTRRCAACMAKFWRDISRGAGRFDCGPRAAAWRSPTRSSGSGTFRFRRTSRARMKRQIATAIRPCTHAEAGSVAAPTAGLHFTDRVLGELRTRGVEQVALTLHVGYGTFKPVRVENVDEHEVDPEFYTVSPSTAEALDERAPNRPTHHRGGTTTTARARVVDGRCIRGVQPASGSTSSFIHPCHRFRVVQA